MGKCYIVLCLSISMLIICFGIKSTRCDTGITDTNSTKTCSLIDEEIQILSKLLSQELTIRDIKENLENLTDETARMTKVKDLILSIQGEIKYSLGTTNKKVNELSKTLDASIVRMDTLQKSFIKRFKRLETRVTNLFETDSSLVGIDNIQNETDDSCKTENTGPGVSGTLDCSDIHRIFKETKSGPYRIYTKRGVSHMAYCDMSTDGGGWTVFQRRQDGRESFDRRWNAYTYGFGNISGEHWLGNMIVSELSANCPNCELRIDLEDFEGNRSYAKYSNFSIGSEVGGFVLTVGNYSGNAGDSLVRRVKTYIHNGMKFSTNDKDQDKWKHGNCATDWKGGWWFNSCFGAHLNGWYYEAGKHMKTWNGIIWLTWKGGRYSLKSTRMMMRKVIK